MDYSSLLHSSAMGLVLVAECEEHKLPRAHLDQGFPHHRVSARPEKPLLALDRLPSTAQLDSSSLRRPPARPRPGPAPPPPPRRPPPPVLRHGLDGRRLRLARGARLGHRQLGRPPRNGPPPVGARPPAARPQDRPPDQRRRGARPPARSRRAHHALRRGPRRPARPPARPDRESASRARRGDGRRGGGGERVRVRGEREGGGVLHRGPDSAQGRTARHCRVLASEVRLPSLSLPSSPLLGSGR